MAEHRVDGLTALPEALARLDLVESRVTRLEKSVNKAVGTLMPKVDSLLSGRTLDQPSESTSSISSTHGPLPMSVLELAERGDGEALFQLLAAEEIDVQSSSLRTEKGDTALHVAASGGHLRAVVVLVGMGAKVNASGHLLRTPLHCAAAQGHLTTVKRLLIAGAEVDAKDVNGATPLVLAAGQGNEDLVNLLLKMGAQPNEKAVSLAAENGHWNLVEFFTLKGDFVNACNKEGHPLIVQAAKGNRWEMVEQLLKRGASATKSKDVKECALVYASNSGEVDVVRELLQRGAAKNADQVLWALGAAKSAAVVWMFMQVAPDHMRGYPGTFGLILSGRDGRLQPLVAFLEAGVDVNGRDGAQVSALHRAARNGQITCVRELVQRGANINACDKDGNTPLHMASLQGQVECVRALLDAGANTTNKNKLGKTPVDVASSDDVRAVFSSK
ncbi:hypothetical protein R5R35_009796 [Gryllus longicercus]|uniref:Uncharacterized protein n=1 Tax=Gryllus longicercus TaxID=2509291 RepID=A0AAN9VMR8_9ORTH